MGQLNNPFVVVLALCFAAAARATLSTLRAYPLVATSVPYKSRVGRRRYNGWTTHHRDDPYRNRSTWSAERRSDRALLASSRRTSRSERNNKTSRSRGSDRRLQKTTPPQRSSRSSASQSQVEQPPLTYEDLTPLGKIIAGSIEVAIVTLMDYVSGFLGGYAIGAVADIPRMLFRPATAAEQDGMRRSFFRELTGRCSRMHGKSVRWAKNWAGISAAFGGFSVATRLVRGGVDDEWNTVLSSMAAGAFFARAEGPQAMLRGAVLYGGLVYLLNGGYMGQKEPFHYREQPIDY